MIRALNWTPADTEALRRSIEHAAATGQAYVMVLGKTFSTEYARHRLACLIESQTDTVSERETDHVQQ